MLVHDRLAELQQAVAAAEADDRALAILLTGRKFDTAEAARLGVVNRTIEHDWLLEHARDYLTSLATHSAPRSLQTMKHQVYKHLDASLGDAMRESLRLMEESLKRDELKEGVASYVEKRAPRFERIQGSEADAQRHP